MSNAFVNFAHNFGAAVAFSGLGILLFIVAFFIADRLTPGTLWKELLEDQNVAVANLMGCVAIALAIIIAASIV